MNLAPVAKALVAASGAVLTYVLTLLAPTGTAAHVVTAVVLAGTVAGVWAVPNAITYAQALGAMREQSVLRPASISSPAVIATPPPPYRTTSPGGNP